MRTVWLLAGLILAGCAPHHDFTRKPFRTDARYPSAYRWSVEPDVQASTVRLLIVGDGGHIRRARQVQRLLVDACEEQPGGCDAVLVLGNNVRPLSSWNGQSRSYIEEWSRAWGAPVYFALGRRDYGLLGRARRADKQLEHIAYLPRMGVEAHGSAHHYSFNAGPLLVDVVDTTDLRRSCGPRKDPSGPCTDQQGGEGVAWARRLKEAPATWRLVAVHRPLQTSTGKTLPADHPAAQLIDGLDVHLIAAGQGHHLEYRATDARAMVQSGAAGRRGRAGDVAADNGWTGKVETQRAPPRTRKMAQRQTVERTAHGGLMVIANEERICVVPVPVARSSARTWERSGVGEPGLRMTRDGGTWETLKAEEECE